MLLLQCHPGKEIACGEGLEVRDELSGKGRRVDQGTSFYITDLGGFGKIGGGDKGDLLIYDHTFCVESGFLFSVHFERGWVIVKLGHSFTRPLLLLEIVYKTSNEIFGKGGVCISSFDVDKELHLEGRVFFHSFSEGPEDFFSLKYGITGEEDMGLGASEQLAYHGACITAGRFRRVRTCPDELYPGGAFSFFFCLGQGLEHKRQSGGTGACVVKMAKCFSELFQAGTAIITLNADSGIGRAETFAFQCVVEPVDFHG
jgi:hypothetical protein